MAKYRDSLPQLSDRLFLTDGGLETTLIFNEGLELPDFAAFHLLRTEDGAAALTKYFTTYADIARRHNAGLILESATWRASRDWGERLGYSPGELTDVNKRAISMLAEIRDELETDQTPMVISGCIGPRGDGYVVDRRMNPDEAQRYHSGQMEVFAGSAADMACAVTMNYVEEALGIVRAAQSAGMPVAISFTLETDGSLPTGESLASAIDHIDEVTLAYPAYYMINCAHPTHFQHVLGSGEWRERIRGLRANASFRSHAELNEAPDLDAGNPEELATQYAELRDTLTRLNVMGGCCGTDHRHIERIAEACALR